MPRQSVNQVTVKTGGKLYIAGEYSVLTPGQTALIQFIPIFMSAEVKEAQTTQLSSDMFDYSVSREPDANYALIQEALNTFEAFVVRSYPLWTFPSLESWNEMGLNLVSVLRVLLWY